MNANLERALAAGIERLAAWADLLDRINVFPVADGDTGRNMVMSLIPLKDPGKDQKELIERLLLSARGNSGNIAARFFMGFLSADVCKMLSEAVKKGKELAWQAVPDPQPGTMLSFFEALDEALNENMPDEHDTWISNVLDRLEHAVCYTTDQLPVLKKAGVVDAGALGMFIFFDGFLNILYRSNPQFKPIARIFQDRLDIRESWFGEDNNSICVDAVFEWNKDPEQALQSLPRIGQNLVAIEHGKYLKVHFHTDNPEHAKNSLSRVGSMLKWHADDLKSQTEKFQKTHPRQAIHLMTDAAGSVTRDDASALDITLLDSYISIGDFCAPETHIVPSEMYSAMQKKGKVTTSQASIFERYQHYEKALSFYKNVLYLCVGSIFTGNYRVAMDFKTSFDSDNRLRVIDTKAASGRLGLIAITTARYSLTAQSAEDVAKYALRAIDTCEEYIFLERLHYLAAGGRISPTSAFFGDMLNMKPVVTPVAEGAKKVAMVRNLKEQLQFIFQKMEKAYISCGIAIIMLEYSDNEQWVSENLKLQVQQRFPEVEILLRPFSLTSGAHTGPGTWAVAFLPKLS